jgi:hypothetical protein
MQRAHLTRRQFSVHLWLALLVPLLGNGYDPTGNVIEKNAMQITLERSGGFTGMPLTIKVDTAALSPAQVTQLRHLVDATDFFHLPATTATPAQPDRYEYEVTVQEGDRTHTITFGDVAVPERLKPLLSWLMETAR